MNLKSNEHSPQSWGEVLWDRPSVAVDLSGVGGVPLLPSDLPPPPDSPPPRQAEPDHRGQNDAAALHRLECVLVETAEQDERIDDQILSVAMQSFMNQAAPKRELPASLHTALIQWSEMEAEPQRSLATVRQAIERLRLRSTCEQGDFDYLICISESVKRHRAGHEWMADALECQDSRR